MTDPAYVLLVVTARGVVEHALPARGNVTIGRGEDNAICISDPSVSRRHAVLEVGPRLAIEDLGASNGTHVHRAESEGSAGQTENVRSLHREAGAIHPGDRILLGSVPIAVRKATEPTSGRPTAIVIRDPRMADLCVKIEQAAASRVSVLLVGETGVGKEVFARRIHDGSPRKDGPFVALNCAALPETLLDAELFGAEKGAYTGAAQARAGLFEAADGGTLFLDEIGELAPSTQAKLLRVLEDRKVTRIGGRTPRDVDVRFVAATHRDLRRAIEENSFRSDLYYRLAGITFAIPPLRERRAEIEPLARHFLEIALRELERSPLDLSEGAVRALLGHAWPGNVRELRNAMERAAVLSAGPSVCEEDLPISVTAPDVEAPAAPIVSSGAPHAADQMPLKDEIRELEKQRILRALKECGGNQTRAAEALGISRRTLTNRLNEYEVERPRKR